MKPIHTEFWSLPRTQKGLNIDKEEQQYVLDGSVCLIIYHTVAINFPRSGSHSYKLPEKNTFHNFLLPGHLKSRVPPPLGGGM